MFDNNEVDLKTLVLQNNRTDNKHRFTLSATYQIIKPNGAVEETTFHRIELPIYTDRLPVLDLERFGPVEMSCFGDFGFGQAALLPNYKNAVYTTKVIKEPDPKEMTMEEIEKKLGYPIKIVKEKRNEQEKK